MNVSPAIVFDLDGTLADTYQDIGEAMNRTLAQEGFPERPLEFYLTAIGNGMKKLLERCLHPHLLPPEREQEILIRFKADYTANLLVNSRLYPGIADLLAHLEAAGIPKAVFSNKPDALTRMIVEQLMGNWSFTAIRGNREGVPHKPDPAATLSFLQDCHFHPASTYMVGDTSTDMETAIGAGMIPIGVRWGFRSEKELLDHGARSILHHPGDLIDILSLADPLS